MMKTASVLAFLFVSVLGNAAGPAAAATPLKDLVAEAAKLSPQVIAAERQWDATKYAAKQAGALPDTELMVQHLSVGSPRPFAGYSNSDFAYIGLGASQEIPFPGKRGLRARVAESESEVSRQQSVVVRQDVIERVKLAYFRLAYLQQTLSLLEQKDHSLSDIEQITESRYRVGEGTQQDVLKAQLQHTKILNEIAMHHREVGQWQAELKSLLNRTQESPDIVTEVPSATAMPNVASSNSNPDLELRSVQVKQTEAAISSAEKERKPDFNVQYMWQHTADNFRDYYMASFGIRLPNPGRVKAAVAEAVAKRQHAKAELDATQRTLEAEIQKQVVFIHTSEDQLRIYRDGLIPQGQATLRASIAGYQTGKQDFETLLSAFNDVVGFQIEYQQELAEHESAVARLQRLAGGAQ
jgi:outer membrane protein, heavy metal efflux system